jgi:hypothetical protein
MDHIYIFYDIVKSIIFQALNNLKHVLVAIAKHEKQKSRQKWLKCKRKILTWKVCESRGIVEDTHTTDNKC